MGTSQKAKNGLAVVAVGGNALILDDNHKTVPDQFSAAKRAMKNVADIVEDGLNVVLTHGNGPQIGYILRRSELALSELHPVPMDYAGADTQGAIGYMFQKALRNEMVRRGMVREVISVVTQVKVAVEDKAFLTPTKPIGSYMQEEIANQMVERYGWTVSCEEGVGWRRIVPSPYPIEIVELDSIKQLIDAGTVVIACGGGGIPVVERSDGSIRGVEAVIDKDYASSMLASEINADLFVITTNVNKVAINYGRVEEHLLSEVSVTELIDHQSDGQFPVGSMGPKVDAAITFVQGGGSMSIITDIDNLSSAIKGKTGTLITDSE